MAKVVNIDDLKRFAVEYDNYLRELPFFKLNEIAKRLRIRIIRVKGEHVIVSKRRKAGILRPYKPGMTLRNQQELMKFFEAKIKPEKTYAELFDNINNYKEVKVISNAGEMVNNKTKKHPLEFLILNDMVTSYGEDVAFNLFFAERDEDVKSAATAFTGFNPKLDILIAAGEISAAKKNLVTTGAFDMPVDGDDTDSYDKMVDFLKQVHPMMKQGETLLYATDKPLQAALAAYANKVKYHNDPTMAQMLEKLRSDAELPNLNVIRDPVLGTGDRLMLAKPGLLDLGTNEESDGQFVQVRNIFDDPNDVQFWIQADWDTRIVDIHPKLFMMNEQSNTGVNLAGDY
jgi:hypothetical protein